MFGVNYVKVQPTTFLLQYRGGKVAREGVGLSFFYYSPTTSLVTIPIASTDAAFIFQETTGDFQTVTVQGQVTFRIAEPKRLAALLNYTLARNGETYTSDDPEKLPQRVINVVNVLARAELQKLPLREALRASDALVQKLKAGLASSNEISSLGLEILGLSILAIKPTPETSRALEAETREKLFREADEALYARRNAAVEQERAIKENERILKSPSKTKSVKSAKRKWKLSVRSRRNNTCSNVKRSRPTSAWKINAKTSSLLRLKTPGPRPMHASYRRSPALP